MLVQQRVACKFRVRYPYICYPLVDKIIKKGFSGQKIKFRSPKSLTVRDEIFELLTGKLYTISTVYMNGAVDVLDKGLQ